MLCVPWPGMAIIIIVRQCSLGSAVAVRTETENVRWPFCGTKYADRLKVTITVLEASPLTSRCKYRGSEDSLVAIAVEGVVGVSGAGHIVGGGGGIDGGVVYQAILSIEGIPTWVVPVVANAKFKVTWVVVVVAGANVVRWLACSVVFEVSKTVLWGLCLRLRYRLHIAIIYA